MALIILKVKPHLNRWDVVHNDVTLASCDTREAAEVSALAVAKQVPAGSTAEIDLIRADGSLEEMLTT